MEKCIGDTGASCHVIGTRDVLNNQKYVSPQNVIIGYGRKSSMTFSGKLELLLKKKNSKNPGSESSIKYFKEHCECGDIVTGWGRDVIKPWDNEC